MSVEDAIAATVNYKLYWLELFDRLFLLPVRGWFTTVPLGYCMVSIIGLLVYALLIGSRSAFLALAISVVLVYVGKISARSGDFVRRHFVVIGILMLGVMAISKWTYEGAVKRGWLGAAEEKKYAAQTKGGNSALQLIMAGRVEFFVGLYAASSRPLIGRGSWVLDRDDIYLSFLHKYGAQEDYERAMKVFARNPGLRRIPAHSHLVTYWMWHGIFALIFWIYVLWLICVTLIRYINVVPGLYGYFALGLPIFIWDICFSPQGNRIPESMLIVLCLMVKRIASQRMNHNVCFKEGYMR